MALVEQAHLEELADSLADDVAAEPQSADELGPGPEPARAHGGEDQCQVLDLVGLHPGGATGWRRHFSLSGVDFCLTGAIVLQRSRAVHC